MNSVSPEIATKNAYSPTGSSEVGRSALPTPSSSDKASKLTDLDSSNGNGTSPFAASSSSTLTKEGSGSAMKASPSPTTRDATRNASLPVEKRSAATATRSINNTRHGAAIAGEVDRSSAETLLSPAKPDGSKSAALSPPSESLFPEASPPRAALPKEEILRPRPRSGAATGKRSRDSIPPVRREAKNFRAERLANSIDRDLLQVALLRRCPSILADRDEYDDEVVSLCGSYRN
jgi:hypothetical protein